MALTPIVPINVPTVKYDAMEVLKAVLRDTGSQDYALNCVIDGGVTLTAGDIEIGAVEIKNASTDDRVNVSDANTARAATDHVLLVQALDASGAVIGNSVTADTELPAAALLADATAYPTTPTVGAVLKASNGTTSDMIRLGAPAANPGNVGVLATQLHVSDNTDIQRVLAPLILGDGVNGNNMLSIGSWNWNGTTWDRVKGDTTNGALVNLGTNNDVTLATLPDTAAGDLAAIRGTVSGSELQVDVLSMPSVTVDSEFPAAAAITDDFANPTTTSVMSMLMGWDGSAFDRMPGNATDGLKVNMGADNDVTLATLPDTAAGDLAAISSSAETLAGAVSGTEVQVDIVASLPAGTNAIGKLVPPTTLLDGTKTVAATATPEALASTTACRRVVLKTLDANTSTYVMIGNATSQSIRLDDGATYTLEIDDLAKIYIDVATNGDGVAYNAEA